MPALADVEAHPSKLVFRATSCARALCIRDRNATAPAVNVKESATAYTMEVAAPGLKKDTVKMNIDKDGYLNVSIENKDEKKEEKEEHYLRRGVFNQSLS